MRDGFAFTYRLSMSITLPDTECQPMGHMLLQARILKGTKLRSTVYADLVSGI